jgi:hypothetical protein
LRFKEERGFIDWLDLIDDDRRVTLPRVSKMSSPLAVCIVNSGYVGGDSGRMS